MNSRFDPRPDGDPGSWPNDEFFEDHEDFARDFDEQLEPMWFCDYVDGELTPEERDRYDEMLAADAELARRFASYRERVRLCAAIGSAERRVDGGTVLREKILADASRHMPAPSRRGFGFAFAASISLAAASVVLFFALQQDGVADRTSTETAATTTGELEELDELAKDASPARNSIDPAGESRFEDLDLTAGGGAKVAAKSGREQSFDDEKRVDKKPARAQALQGADLNPTPRGADEGKIAGKEAGKKAESDGAAAETLRYARGAAGGGGGAPSAPATRKPAGPSTPGPSSPGPGAKAPSSKEPGAFARGGRADALERRRRGRGRPQGADLEKEETSDRGAAGRVAKEDPANAARRMIVGAKKRSPQSPADDPTIQSTNKSKIALEEAERGVLKLGQQGDADSLAFLGVVTQKPAELRANVLRVDVPAADVAKLYELIDAQRLARVQIADATRLSLWSKLPGDESVVDTSNLTKPLRFAVQPGDVLFRIEGEREQVVRGTVTLLGRRKWNPTETTLHFGLASPDSDTKAGLVAKSVSETARPEGGAARDKKAPAEKRAKLEPKKADDRETARKVSDRQGEAKPSRAGATLKGWTEWQRALDLAGDKTRSSLLVYVRVIDAAPAQKPGDPTKKTPEIEDERAIEAKRSSIEAKRKPAKDQAKKPAKKQ